MAQRSTALLRSALVAGSLTVAACGQYGDVGAPDPAAVPATTGAASAATMTTARAPTDATTTTTPPPPTGTAPPLTSSDPVTTAPATTTPVPTMAPIGTHDARVGVLVPVAVAAPVRVAVPVIAADGPVTPAGVDAAGELAIPDDAGELVWWRHGPAPGAPGSAVIAGHLDWKGELGIFDRLAETPVGERVVVTYDDGHEQTFVVTSVELVDKPAVAVDGTFARDGAPTLRLVTCGGEFDRASRSYRSNVIVTAVPA